VKSVTDRSRSVCGLLFKALFRRLSDPVRRDILPLRVRRRQQAKAGAGAACWCAAAVLPADLCGCDARAEADPPAAVGAIPLPQLRRSLPFPPRCLSVRCCLRSASRPADFFAAGVRGSRLSRGQRRAAEAAAVGTAAPVPLCRSSRWMCELSYLYMVFPRRHPPLRRRSTELP
jgi:site-specific DNA-cytosine methylase